MEEIQTQARLVDPSTFAGRAVSTVLPRAEIERAILEGGYPAELRLEISRPGHEGGEPERAEVFVSWQEQELNELLRASGTDADVTLWFDGSELEHALAADVEAHGLRERTAILAITVAAAGATAGGAFAHPQLVGAAGGGAGQSATAQSFASDVASSDAVARYQANLTAGQPISDVASSAAVARSEAAAAGSEADALSRYEANVGTGGAGDALSRFEANVAAGGGGDALSRYQANAATDTAPAASVSVSSSSWSPTAAEDAALAAGIALLITGAGFVTARTRRQHMRPA